MASQTMTKPHPSVSNGYIPLTNMSLTSLTSTKNDYDVTFSETSTIAPSTYAFNSSKATPFTPITTLQVQTVGKNCISLPLSTSELIIPIFATTPNQLRSDSDNPAYLSIRPNRKSGSCHLVIAKDETETAIARTTYRWGPGKPPVVRLGADDDLSAQVFEMNGVSVLTRSVGFELPGKGKFVWRYGKKKERTEMHADNLLILEKIVSGKKGGFRVAQLIRSDETRTPGTGRNCAGNGGRLEMDLTMGEDGQDLKGNEVISEVAVLVTCLVMLKKEIDRLRATQIAVVGAVVSGAS